MTETISIILFITSLVVFVLLAAAALLYVVVKIMMADEINSNDFLSDFYDRNDNSDDD